MKSLLIERGFNIIVLMNGYEKSVWIDGTKYLLNSFKTNSENEFSDIMSEIRNKYPNHILAITGNLCERRGLTIQSKSCMIDYCIVSPFCVSQPKDLYQLVVRCCGSVKTFDSYQSGNRIHIICTSETKKKLLSTERKTELITLKSDLRPVINREYINHISQIVNLELEKESSTSSVDTFESWMKINGYTENTIKDYSRMISKHCHHKNINNQFFSSYINSIHDEIAHNRESCALKAWNRYIESKEI